MFLSQRRPRVFAHAVTMSVALGLALSSTLSVSIPASAVTTLKIGIDLPTSGADASNGIPTRNGAVLAIEEANSKGLPGGNKLEADSLDDTTQGVHDPAQGAKHQDVHRRSGRGWSHRAIQLQRGQGRNPAHQ